MSEACEQVQRMLPWVANHTAAADEVAEVYLHVASCQECRRQLVQTIALWRRLHEAAEALPATPTDGWDRLAAALTPTAGELDLVLKRWLPALEACGLPPAVTRLLHLGRALGDQRWAVSIDVPLWQTVTVRA
ncbi:MAG: hypothetical protein HPY69_07105 [Armatimonadetes bacterium]|nr:hypothetical protein [Armatimonadota bacterium]